MTRFRWWLTDRLLDVLRYVCPLPPGKQRAPRWQIIEVPRRITRGEADRIAAEVEQL